LSRTVEILKYLWKYPGEYLADANFNGVREFVVVLICNGLRKSVGQTENDAAARRPNTYNENCVERKERWSFIRGDILDVGEFTGRG
jgi:hypothetical protein